MKKFDHVYVNGCSFTGDWYRRDRGEPVYGDLIAKELGSILQNSGKPNSCNRRIVRSTVRDSINFPSNTLALIQLTFLHRTEKHSDVNEKNSWKFDREDYHESVKPQEPSEFMTAFVNQFDPRAEFTVLAADLLMLSSYFKQRGISYLIYSFPTLIENAQHQQELEHTSLYYELCKDPCIIDPLKRGIFKELGLGDYFYDANGASGEIGHLNTLGHQTVTDNLLHLINSTY